MKLKLLNLFALLSIMSSSHVAAFCIILYTLFDNRHQNTKINNSITNTSPQNSNEDEDEDWSFY